MAGIKSVDELIQKAKSQTQTKWGRIKGDVPMQKATKVYEICDAFGFTMDELLEAFSDHMISEYHEKAVKQMKEKEEEAEKEEKEGKKSKR